MYVHIYTNKHTYIYYAVYHALLGCNNERKIISDSAYAISSLTHLSIGVVAEIPHRDESRCVSLHTGICHDLVLSRHHCGYSPTEFSILETFLYNGQLKFLNSWTYP